MMHHQTLNTQAQRCNTEDVCIRDVFLHNVQTTITNSEDYKAVALSIAVAATVFVKANHAMDLLASLRIDDLPEEQTRAAHLVAALAKDPDIRVGFNACATCASQENVTVECNGCCRVRYCSKECRKKDANPSMDGEEAMGHSPIICAVLRTCNDDEDAEDSETAHKASEAARDRVRSEYESYPATLSNILTEGPCYQGVLTKCSKRNKILTIHVIGASEEAELWNGKDHDDVFGFYAEALAQLAEAFSFEKIQLHMVGPDCPKEALKDEKSMKLIDSKTCYQLQLMTHKATYDTVLLNSLPVADAVVFFNPGFTCPDYYWDDTVRCLKLGTAFCITTNTHNEGVEDCLYLLENELIPALPSIVSEIVGIDAADESGSVFFSENPYAGSRVRQSGTMANDIYVKNRWMCGGVFGEGVSSSKGDKFNRRDRYDEDSSKPPAKKAKPTSNSKITNPALI